MEANKGLGHLESPDSQPASQPLARRFLRELSTMVKIFGEFPILQFRPYFCTSAVLSSHVMHRGCSVASSDTSKYLIIRVFGLVASARPDGIWKEDASKKP